MIVAEGGKQVKVLGMFSFFGNKLRRIEVEHALLSSFIVPARSDGGYCYDLQLLDNSSAPFFSALDVLAFLCTVFKLEKCN